MNETQILKLSLIIYAGIFVFALALTAVMAITKRMTHDRNIWIGTLSWFVIFAVFLVADIAGIVPFSILILVISCALVWEFNRAFSLPFWPSTVWAWLVLVLLSLANLSARTDLFWMAFVVGVSAMPALQLFRGTNGFARRSGLSVFSLTYWGLGFYHLALIRGLEGGFGLIVAICSMIALDDNTAYYTGRTIGKRSRKLAPGVSPGKTWVGTISGFLACMVVAFGFSFALGNLSWLEIALVALAVGIAVPLGDLAESAMKRDIGVKDMGWFIPGHGGFCDRFDSWAFAGPVAYYLLYLLTR
ncbi:MAG: phosphatidate cytidylyltransferase [candidate division WOR-3 bacterium]